MTPTQRTIIASLAIAAAIGIMFFDKSGRTHKTASSVLAWLVFCQMGCLAVAAMIGAAGLVQWLMIGSLAVHTVNIIMAKGNVNKVRPHVSFATWFSWRSRDTDQVAKAKAHQNTPLARRRKANRYKQQRGQNHA